MISKWIKSWWFSSQPPPMDWVEIVHAIQSDEKVKGPLIRILEMPQNQRETALRGLAQILKDREAPESLIQCLILLQDEHLHTKVLTELQRSD